MTEKSRIQIGRVQNIDQAMPIGEDSQNLVDEAFRENSKQQHLEMKVIATKHDNTTHKHNDQTILGKAGNILQELPTAEQLNIRFDGSKTLLTFHTI